MKIQITEKNYGMLLAMISGLYNIRIHIDELLIHGHKIELPYNEVFPLDQWTFTQYCLSKISGKQKR